MLDYLMKALTAGHSDFLTTLLVFLLSFLVGASYLRNQAAKKYPPGPRGLPIIGSLLSIGKRPYITFAKMAEKYGGVISVRMGMQRLVVLNGWEAIKEAFLHNGHKFSGRPGFGPQGALPKGLTFSDYGDTWYEQRRFMLKGLRECGVGKLKVEEIVRREVGYFLDFLEGTAGEPIDAVDTIECAISNIVCTFGFDNRYDYNDEKFTSTIRIFFKIASIVENSSAANFFPFLRYFPGQDKSADVLRLKLPVEQFVGQIIEDHRASFDPEDIRDFTDAYLLEREREKETGRASSFSDDSVMLATLIDLFSASTLTTSDTLYWACLYLGTNPEVQRRVQAEIDEVVGDDRRPCFADKLRMPYTHATVLETLRSSAPAPLAIPHSTTEDVTLRGYHIPKGTCVLANIWSALYDPRCWENPERFDPSRFIGNNGEILKNSAFIPFSAGKRACTGENLAKMNLFLFLSSILQRFDLTFPDDARKPRLEGQPGITNRPYPYKICVKARKTSRNVV